VERYSTPWANLPSGHCGGPHTPTALEEQCVARQRSHATVDVRSSHHCIDKLPLRVDTGIDAALSTWSRGALRSARGQARNLSLCTDEGIYAGPPLSPLQES
jgi:hypothetical protein